MAQASNGPVSEMGRQIETILAAWRQLERELDASTNEDDREELEARIASLAEEHRAAVEKMMPADERPDFDALGA